MTTTFTISQQPQQLCLFLLLLLLPSLLLYCYTHTQTNQASLFMKNESSKPNMNKINLKKKKKRKGLQLLYHLRCHPQIHFFFSLIDIEVKILQISEKRKKTQKYIISYNNPILKCHFLSVCNLVVYNIWFASKIYPKCF